MIVAWAVVLAAFCTWNVTGPSARTSTVGASPDVAAGATQGATTSPQGATTGPQGAMTGPQGASAGATAGPAGTSAGASAGGPAVSTGACTNTAVLQSWSLQRLAEQTIVVPVDETDVAAVAPAAKDGYGGIILFGSSAPANLGAQLAALRADVPGHVGLLVMTDEEGGGVQRMANLVGSMPWPQQMGATMTPAQIEALTHTVGQKMAKNGVNMNLAPVVDVDGRHVEPGASDPDGFRSFSGKTSVVSADGVAFERGMRAGGVVPTVKHFPGLGGSSGNTDDGPAKTLPWSTLKTVAIPPFQAAIKAGVPAVMISNAIVPGFTTEPAVLSRSMVTGELRGALGFGGLIITDSLSAKALSDPPLSLSVPQASVKAIEAGADMVEYGLTGTASGDLALAASTAHAIVAAVGSGALPKSQLVAAVAHVLTTKGVSLCTAVKGYWIPSSAGNVWDFGNATFFGSRAAAGVPAPVVGLAPSVDGRGYWLATSKGNVFPFGDAVFYGSRAAAGVPAPVVGLAPTADGRGYWLVTSKGTVYAYGDAASYGSKATSGVVGLAPTADGRGYWLVTSKGNVFPFGDAVFYGSRAAAGVPAPVVGLAATPDGRGYWLVTSKGNVFDYGTAVFYGSRAAAGVPAPVVGLAATPDGRGYWLVTSKGNVFPYGDAAFHGSLATTSLPARVVGLVPD